MSEVFQSSANVNGLPPEGSVHPFSWGKISEAREPNFATSQQVEGFSESTSSPEDHALLASARFWWLPEGLQWRTPRDHRGAIAKVDLKAAQSNTLAWRTAAAPQAQETTFTFAGCSAVLPQHTYPDPLAKLYVDDCHILSFPLGRHSTFRINEPKGALEFIPLRYIAPVENSLHRQGLEVGAASGLYRINLPAELIRAGEPVTIRVEVQPVPEEVTAWFAVTPRRDALVLSLQTVHEEVRRLQADVIQLKETVDRLGRKLYAEIHPEKLSAQHSVVSLHTRTHVHPPNVTLLQNGEMLVTYREGSEHVSDDGIGVLLRSRDEGRTWGERVVLFEHPYTDLRQVPITQLRDGTLLCTALIDYTFNGERYSSGMEEVHPEYKGRPPSIYILRSTDNGHTWQEIAGPIATPNHMLEVSKQMVELPHGHILMATAFVDLEGDHSVRSQVLMSQDRGLTWRQQGATPRVNAPITGEPALARMSSGRLIMIVRTEMETDGAFYQSTSEDDGATWSTPVKIPLPSMSAPAHLLVLRDGRLLCTYGTRRDPRSIYICLSSDEGCTWDLTTRRVLIDDVANLDSQYPSTVELPNGELFTAYYDCKFGRYGIFACRYRLEESRQKL